MSWVKLIIDKRLWVLKTFCISVINGFMRNSSYIQIFVQSSLILNTYLMTRCSNIVIGWGKKYQEVELVLCIFWCLLLSICRAGAAWVKSNWITVSFPFGWDFYAYFIEDNGILFVEAFFIHTEHKTWLNKISSQWNPYVVPLLVHFCNIS